MKNKLKKTLSLCLVQALMAMTFPVAAQSSTLETDNGFKLSLPINEKIEVGEGTAEATIDHVNTLVTRKTLTKDNLTGVLTLEDVLGDQAQEAVELDQEPDVIVIDNDLEGEFVVDKGYKWEEIQDSPEKTKISAGARFPVTVISSLSSKTARVGDPVEARLMADIMIGGRLVAREGDQVIGRISSCSKARRILHAEFSKSRWMRANGCLGVQFDQIITSEGKHLPLEAKPARVARVVKNKNEGRVLGVNHNGELASPLSTQLKHQAAHLAIRSAASVGGVFSMGAVPAAYGIIGAINPSFAFLQPVGKNVPHRRIKGFAMGVVSGLPGGFLIADTIIKGKEAVIKPGDTFLAEFKQEFTGRAATSAELLPGSAGKVRGEVMPVKN